MERKLGPEFPAEMFRDFRLFLCPECDAEILTDEEEVVCSCGAEASPITGGYPEEFIWHPNRRF